MKPDNDVFNFTELDEKILQKMDFEELSVEVEKINNSLKEHETFLLQQKEMTNKHLVLFQDVLGNLAKDHEEFKKIKKNLKCLTLTVQILLGAFLSFVAFVLFHIFRI